MYTFEPVRTRKTFEEAVEQIAGAIRAGDLNVGDRLPSERVLAVQMAISRPTVRDALKVLVDSGVLEVRPGPAGGAFVRSDVVPRMLLDADTTTLRVSEVSGVLEARRLLEPRVAQLAALYGTEDDFDAMRRTIDLQRESSKDRTRFLQLDERFHLSMARATRNETVIALVRTLLRRLDVARELAIRVPHDPEWAIAIHERTLQAVVSGRPDLVEAAMDEHLGYLEGIWEEESGRARLRPIPAFLLPHDAGSPGAATGSSPARPSAPA